jgi:hypothetical protein
MRKNKEISFDMLLDDMLKPVFKKVGFANIKVHKAWPDIISKNLSSICALDRISYNNTAKKDGTLHILIKNPAFTLEIQSKESFIVNQVNMFLGYNAVNRIKVNISNNPSLFTEFKNTQQVTFPKKTLPKSEDISDDLHKALEELYSTI